MPDAPRSPRFKLWGIGTGRTLRPIWTAVELGLVRDVDFELVEVLTRTARMERPDFKAVSPRGKIPMLEDGDLRIGESAAISLHLADCSRDRATLAPRPGTRERTVHDELCWFAMTEMDAILYILRRHDGLPEIYGASEVAVESAKAYFQRSSEEIERRLQDGRPFVTGQTFTVADIVVFTCYSWSQSLYQIPLGAAFHAYGERVSARPSLAAATAMNFTPEAMAALAGKDVD